MIHDDDHDTDDDEGMDGDDNKNVMALIGLLGGVGSAVVR